jgi:hypothetical protein
MKLFLYALMTTFVLVGCESHHREDDGAIQEQQEDQREREIEKEMESKPIPEKGGNAGNR